jgi:D-aspartate ligase
MADHSRVPAQNGAPQAWVLGAIDLVHALNLAGIPVVAVADPQDPARYSRAAVAGLERRPASREPEAMVDWLLAAVPQDGEPPVLYYDNDWDLLLVSRHRDELARRFRFVAAPAELVEDLVDKTRFHELAQRLGLPVPPTVRCSSRDLADHGLRYPLVVKPVSRHGGAWSSVVRAKAAHVADPTALAVLAEQLADTEIDVLVQEAVPGPESRVESYHVFVDGHGGVAGEFTGRKLRTWPRTYGYSTAITITDDLEVRDLGRRISMMLGLRGVAKLDFKRAPDGTLYLLEVNPRFNLWHHPGALAGVNLPALVHRELVGRPAAAGGVARGGVTWCSAHDLKAAREEGFGLVRWLRWAVACDAISGFAWDDPFPIPRAALWRIQDRLRRRTAA